MLWTPVENTVSLVPTMSHSPRCRGAFPHDQPFSSILTKDAARSTDQILETVTPIVVAATVVGVVFLLTHE